MSTTRRQFLSALVATPAALLALSKVSSKASESELASPPIMLPDGGPRPYKVQGLAVKVPSNRYYVEDREDICHNGYHPGTNTFYRYVGDWDGTFKLEEGCTNPAYILADLCQRLHTDHDWVTHTKEIAFDAGGISWGTSPLNWQMLYDWGKWSDEEVAYDMTDPLSFGVGPCILQPHRTWSIAEPRGPRLSFCAICHTHEEMVRSRETLRMHCLCWQSTDPRYRTSYPVS